LLSNFTPASTRAPNIAVLPPGYNALADMLVIRADRKEPLIIVPPWLAAEVARVAEQKGINETSPLSSREEKDVSLMPSTAKQAPVLESDQTDDRELTDG
jgi:hypothetical protein